jgi:hypothetical protein
MTIFTATFSAIAVTAAQDVFEIVAPADSRLRLREVRLGQYSDFGDAAAEILSVQILRGHSTTGSGGAAVTPANVEGHAGRRASAATVARNNTTVASGGSPETVLADAFNIAQGWRYAPAEAEMIRLEKAVRLVVRTSAPADSLTMNGTLVFEELGQSPA